jgi:glycerol uptake facilitator protein
MTVLSTSQVVTAAAEAAPSLSAVFVSELLGTAVLLLLGCGVVANVILTDAKGSGSNFHMISWGWGIAVFAGVYVAFKSGAHLNPAVTVGLLANRAGEYAPGVPITLTSTLVYLSAELLGAFTGAVLAFLAYKKHFDRDPDPDAMLGVFCTASEIRSKPWNLVTEAIATFVLVFVILLFGKTPGELGPFAVALLVVGIGASLGGPTGYAINPARDLGPRIAHAVLPIRGKRDSDWGYAWVPVLGPLLGAVLAGLAAAAYI